MAARVSFSEVHNLPKRVERSKSAIDGRLYDALISPRRSAPDERQESFEAMDLIDQLFKDLMSPLVRSYDDSIAGKAHREKIELNKKKIRKFRNRLNTVNLIGDRNSKNPKAQVELSDEYIERLAKVCKAYRSEFQRIESPDLRPERITPRKGADLETVRREQAQLQKELRDAENAKDSVMQRCTADICVLAESYFEEAKGIEANPVEERRRGRMRAMRESVSEFFDRTVTRAKSMSAVQRRKN